MIFLVRSQILSSQNLILWMRILAQLHVSETILMNKIITHDIMAGGLASQEQHIAGIEKSLSNPV